MQKEARHQARQQRRADSGPDWLMIILGTAFLICYTWLAKQMEGISFDTVFIAIFCAILSIFVIQCFRMGYRDRQ